MKNTANIDDDDPFLMANLPRRLTGLPMVVWIGERDGLPHDIRVKVCRVHGDKMVWNDTASVAVRPQPRLVAGQLPAADLRLVSQWIELNRAVIVDYWDGAIFTDEMIQRLQRLP
jgi:hypothetical protein